MILPVNLPELFSRRLAEMRRSPDGLLHASSDLVGSLRHAQLTAAGAPRRPTTAADDIVLMTGTLWHNWAHEALVASGLAFMQEVRLGEYMPEGWTGTADWIFWDSERRGFVLGDMKTIRGDGISWIERGGVKPEHLWQLSAYWHGLYDMGLPMVEGFGVLYWPKDRGREGTPAAPTVVDCTPLPRDTVHCLMQSRWGVTRDYLALTQSGQKTPGNTVDNSPDRFLNDQLAAEQERTQKLVWNPATKLFDLKLVPHWSAAYCPFDPPLCSCSEQGTTKIGHYDLDGAYESRKGFTHHKPAIEPDVQQLRKRRAA